MANYTPEVTIVVLVAPDGEIRFGPTKMKSAGNGQWTIPGLTWVPDQALTVTGADAIITYLGETKRVELPLEFTGSVTPGSPVRIDLAGAVFNVGAGRIH